MSLRIRRATPVDAVRVADLARRCFTETFGHLYPPEDLAYFLDASYTPDTQREALEDPHCAIWLLEDGDDAIGHVYVGPCGLPHPDVAPEDGELKRLYLLPGMQNGGWGAKLFAEAIAWLEREGRRRIWISVWSENFGAQRFYARHGFAKVAEYEFPVGRQRDIEFMYRRDAAAANEIRDHKRAATPRDPGVTERQLTS